MVRTQVDTGLLNPLLAIGIGLTIASSIGILASS